MWWERYSENGKLLFLVLLMGVSSYATTCDAGQIVSKGADKGREIVTSMTSRLWNSSRGMIDHVVNGPKFAYWDGVVWTEEAPEADVANAPLEVRREIGTAIENALGKLDIFQQEVTEAHSFSMDSENSAYQIEVGIRRTDTWPLGGELVYARCKYILRSMHAKYGEWEFPNQKVSAAYEGVVLSYAVKRRHGHA